LVLAVLAVRLQQLVQMAVILLFQLLQQQLAVVMARRPEMSAEAVGQAVAAVAAVAQPVLVVLALQVKVLLEVRQQTFALLAH
jgi:hypothetical protein